MRHGQAGGGEDPPLTAFGRKEIEKMALFCKKRPLEITRICHSGKKRALQTAEIMADALGVPLSEKSGLKPNEAVLAFSNTLENEIPGLLLVSHLPFLTRLASRLVLGEEREDFLALETGSLLLLTQEMGTWKLAGLLSPALLSP